MPIARTETRFVFAVWLGLSAACGTKPAAPETSEQSPGGSAGQPGAGGSSGTTGGGAGAGATSGGTSTL